MLMALKHRNREWRPPYTEQLAKAEEYSIICDRPEEILTIK
jgi:hypothetical protein